MNNRKNPNPTCPVCGEHVRGLDYYVRGTIGQKIGSRWRVSCYKSTCPTFNGQGLIVGKGETLKQAREDYRAKVDAERVKAGNNE